MMTNHRLQGTWDQIKGMGLEMWGELRGDADLFAAGQHERMIGQLEKKQNLSRKEAEEMMTRTSH